MAKQMHFPQFRIDLDGTASRKRGWFIFGHWLSVLSANAKMPARMCNLAAGPNDIALDGPKIKSHRLSGTKLDFTAHLSTRTRRFVISLAGRFMAEFRPLRKDRFWVQVQ